MNEKQGSISIMKKMKTCYSPKDFFSHDNYVIIGKGSVAHGLYSLITEKGKGAYFLDEDTKKVGWSDYICADDIASTLEGNFIFVWENPSDAEIELYNNLDNHSDFQDDSVCYNGGWFMVASIRPDLRKHAAMYKMISCFPDPSGVALDIGSHVGRVSSLLADSFSKVHCFEPSLANTRQLKHHFDGNSNIIINNVAVSDELGELEFYSYGTRSEEGSLVSARSPHEITGTETVPTITIDSYVAENNIKNVKFIKIDAEGVDEQVVNGAERTIRVDDPIFIVEVGGDNYESIHENIFTPYSNSHWIIRIDDMIDATSFYASNGHDEAWKNGLRKGYPDDGYDIMCIPKKHGSIKEVLCKLNSSPQY